MWPSLLSSIFPFVVATLAANSAAHARFLALGDSYTIGEGVTPAQRWPNQLVATLRKNGIAIADPEIVARTGWTTDELAAAMDAHTFHPPYALVALLIGVNNQYRGRDADNYRLEFHRLLERAIALAGKQPQRVVVVSIPDWGITRFGADSGRDSAQIARELDAYNSINAQLTAALHAHYVDISEICRAGGGDADMLVADGLHPSAAQYKRWVEVILPQAREALAAH
ncbi:MAG: SGNH/GDSL hydrolase family protein [Rudaea sp.]